MPAIGYVPIIYIREVKGIYAGIGTYTARVVPQAAILFFMVEVFRGFFGETTVIFFAYSK